MSIKDGIPTNSMTFLHIMYVPKYKNRFFAWMTKWLLWHRIPRHMCPWKISVCSPGTCTQNQITVIYFWVLILSVIISLKTETAAWCIMCLYSLFISFIDFAFAFWVLYNFTISRMVESTTAINQNNEMHVKLFLCD